MSKEFLNNEETNKMVCIKNFLSNIDMSKYDNRFDSFDAKKEIIGWDEITDWIDSLSKQIVGKKYSGIYGVPRGGVILATLLSYKTGLPLLLAPQKNCLVVDDDASTGITLLPYYNRFDIALMYINPDCNIVPTYLYKTYGDTYKVFIWNEENDN